MVPAPLITRKVLFRKAEYSIKIYGGWELPDNEIIYQAELFISVQGSPNLGEAPQSEDREAHLF